MVCAKNKIDSNVVGLSYAEEGCLRVLPDDVSEGDQAGGVWYPLDPNEYSDFGGEIKTVARNPINSSRQRRKGVVTDIEANGGFNQDVTQSNLTRILQGFFFADAHEKPTTHSISGQAGVTVQIANYTASDNINILSGDTSKIKVGHLIKTSMNAQSLNNKDNVVVETAAAGVIGTDQTFVAETVVQGTNKLEVVGYQFGDAVAALTVSGATVNLTRSSGSFVDLNLSVGEWIFIGGEGGDDFSFETGSNTPGYARIKTIAAGSLTLEQCTWTVVADTGTGKTIRIYFGKYLRNEKSINLIKQRSYQLERSLGDDADGTQYEYLIGAIPNEFKLNVPAADKITADLSFVALDNELRTGLTGLKDGTRQSLVVEDAFNTSSDVYQMRLFVHDAAAQTPTSLFAFVEEASVMIKNNASGLKAIGTVGSFDVNIGDFEVGGELKVYFATVAAVQAVKNNADVGFNLICASDNTGFIYDIPLLSLGGGRIDVQKDEPIMLPLTPTGSENTAEFTLSASYFAYLPGAAMAT